MDTSMAGQSGARVPLLLFHAFPFHAGMWEAQVEALSASRTVVTFDCPGFGGGGEAVSGLSLADCARLGSEKLDGLGIDRVVVGGLSMGGYIAMAFLRAFPERTAGLVLANTRAGADSEAARQMRHTQAAGVRASGVQVVADAMLPRLLSETSVNEIPDLRDRVRGMMMNASAEGTAVMLEAMAARPDSGELLSACTLPACIIVGESDVLTPPDEARAMHSMLRGSELHILDGAGHLSNLEAPIRFNTILSRFLDGID